MVDEPYRTPDKPTPEPPIEYRPSHLKTNRWSFATAPSSEEWLPAFFFVAVAAIILALASAR